MADPLSVAARDVLFAHWPVDPAGIDAAVPDALTVATVEGQAWVSAVVLEMTGVALGPLPVSLSPFLQINFRTYARLNGDLGVYFLSLDAANRLAALAGGAVWSLPFHVTRGEVRRRDDTVVVRSRREGTGRLDVRYRPVGDATPVESGSLTEFLVERHRFYVRTGEGIAAGEIERDPWQLSDVEAELRTNTLWEANGLDAPDAEPRFHYSPRFESTTGRPSLVE